MSAFNLKTALASVHNIEDCLEVVTAWIEDKFGKDFFVIPLEEFQHHFGKVNPEDEFYNARIGYFLEWCLLERPLKNGWFMPPVVSFFEECQEKGLLGDSAAEIWTTFAAYSHGLFTVTKSGEESIEVIDMVYQVPSFVSSKSGETLKYLKKGTVFQGFVFGNFSKRFLGQGMIIHPQDASKLIKRHLKTYDRLPTVRAIHLYAKLGMANMRNLRMKHVNPTVFYQSI